MTTCDVIKTAASPIHLSDAVAVVIPSYRVTRHILGVIERIGPEVSHIYVVDDNCPDCTGAFVRQQCRDPRVVVLEHAENQGVGGAVMTGYRAAIADGARVIVKVDGDGQMDAAMIPAFVAPILGGEADYTEGNRFFDLEQIGTMPPLRLIGRTEHWRQFACLDHHPILLNQDAVFLDQCPQAVNADAIQLQHGIRLLRVELDSTDAQCLERYRATCSPPAPCSD